MSWTEHLPTLHHVRDETRLLLSEGDNNYSPEIRNFFKKTLNLFDMMTNTQSVTQRASFDICTWKPQKISCNGFRRKHAVRNLGNLSTMFCRRFLVRWILLNSLNNHVRDTKLFSFGTTVFSEIYLALLFVIIVGVICILTDIFWKCFNDLGLIQIIYV